MIEFPRPTVTVLVDTFNHERFVEEAILSVLEQDFPSSETEILVVDDGSTDRTPEIVRKFGSRVRLIRKTNGGQASAFNVGIPEARGEFIAYLDGDDWWAKSKLTRTAEYFARNPEVGVVGNGVYEFDDLTRKSTTTTPEIERTIRFDSVEDGKLFRQMMCFFGTSRVAIRRSLARRALPIPIELVIEADEYLSTVSTAYSAAGLIKDPLTFYRLHLNNLFQLRSADKLKLRRIQKVMLVIAESLRTKLAAECIHPDVVEALLGPVEINNKRLRLTLDGGKPWETFQVERAESKLSHGNSSLAYRFFKLATLGITLFVPPQKYYQFRAWYGQSRLRRLRSVIGEPEIRSGITRL
jgi:glycosyltransferase involved in cell wall biosynthesis